MKKKILKLLQIFLAKCAKFYIYRTKPKVIWITWSVGKTSCRMIVSGVLKKYLPEKRIYTSEKNFNSELGLVFSVFQIGDYTPWIWNLLKLSIKIFFASIIRQKKYDILILEYWIDHPGDMDFLLGICKPDFSIFTKLDKVHSVYFNTPNGIWDEKLKLLQNTKQKSFLNPLDEFCVKIFDNIKWEKEYFSEIIDYKLEKNKNILKSSFKYESKNFTTNLIGKENIDYIWVGFQILKEFWGKPLVNDFIELDIQGWRMSIFQWIKESILIDSTYNAAPESMKKMIENTFSIRNQLFENYKVILVLWEMRELWDDILWQEHRRLFEYSKNADVILLIWDKMNYLYEEIKRSDYKWFYKFYIKSRDAGSELKKYLEQSKEKHIILFKWSQNTIFTEEALKEVLLNENDKKKLVRQSSDWIMKKEKFFNE